MDKEIRRCVSCRTCYVYTSWFPAPFNTLCFYVPISNYDATEGQTAHVVLELSHHRYSQCASDALEFFEASCMFGLRKL